MGTLVLALTPTSIQIMKGFKDTQDKNQSTRTPFLWSVLYMRELFYNLHIVSLRMIFMNDMLSGNLDCLSQKLYDSKFIGNL